eukprot:TRINITY_DN4353_c0_g2_i1.p2 TRINITY_DN4353_c0_g2~~TRINITY_DN4353_c0_g2_i1.p2  ORF type:complete len:158 (-),score=49.49 TRINITY_DN4353_c0_g2_i1:211-684(-)
MEEDLFGSSEEENNESNNSGDETGERKKEQHKKNGRAALTSSEQRLQILKMKRQKSRETEKMLAEKLPDAIARLKKNYGAINAQKEKRKIMRLSVSEIPAASKKRSHAAPASRRTTSTSTVRSIARKTQPRIQSARSAAPCLPSRRSRLKKKFKIKQ